MLTKNRSFAFERFVLAILAVLSVLPVPPAAADDRNTCQSASGDVAIDGCTRAIDPGSFRGGDSDIATARSIEPDIVQEIAKFDGPI